MQKGDAGALARLDELTAEAAEPPSANAATRAVQRMTHGWSERDWPGLTQQFAPEHWVDDRRALVGVPLVGKEFLANLRLMYEFEEGRWHNAEHGSLSVGRLFGTLRDGGPFEAVFVRLNRYEDGRSVGTELFEVEDLKRAKARFDELGDEYATRERERRLLRSSARTKAGKR